MKKVESVRKENRFSLFLVVIFLIIYQKFVRWSQLNSNKIFTSISDADKFFIGDTSASGSSSTYYCETCKIKFLLEDSSNTIAECVRCKGEARRHSDSFFIPKERVLGIIERSFHDKDIVMEKANGKEQ